MRLSAPIYHLKRKAKLASRKDGLPLHAALDAVAMSEGYTSWSLLAAKAPVTEPAEKLFSRLTPGDLVLVGARPGHGKTLICLELLAQAMKSGRHGVFFTLEYARRDLVDRFRAIGVELSQFDELFTFDDSDAISAGYIIETLHAAEPGTLVVIDYLQLLDQKRDNPELMIQVSALKSSAREHGLILVFISQIDRSYDPATKPCPDIVDVRLPNPLDLSLFNKTCFLNQSEIRFQAAN